MSSFEKVHSPGPSNDEDPTVTTFSFDQHTVNPGCFHTKGGDILGKYKSVDTGTVYHNPSIVQYTKLSRGNRPTMLTFKDYMAILSAYKLIQPERIIIHTYGNIEGKYWDITQKWNKTIVETSKAQRVSQIGGKSVSYIQHQADYIKLHGLLKFGGVISDFDVIVVNGTRLKQLHAKNIRMCFIPRRSICKCWIQFLHQKFNFHSKVAGHL